MSGAAPGAKLVSVRACLFIAGCTSHALLEGMIYAAKQAQRRRDQHVDRRPAGAQRRQQRPLRSLYNRLIEQYNVQMFFSAGNSGPGMNTVGDPAVAARSSASASYITKATWQKQLRLRLGRTSTTCTPSARAARARTAASSRDRRARRGDLDDAAVAAGRPGGRHLRAAARLLDAATARRWRRRRRPARRRCWSARRSRPASRSSRDQLRQALISSARCSITSRYRRLRAGQRPDQRRRGVGPAEDEHQDGRHHARRCRCNTVLSGFLATPGIGAGIYDREGVDARHSLHAHVHVHAHLRRRRQRRPTTVTWVGNDGTFSSRRLDRAAAEARRRRLTSRQSDRRAGVALGDPEPRRPGDGRASTTRR